MSSKPFMGSNFPLDKKRALNTLYIVVLERRPKPPRCRNMLAVSMTTRIFTLAMYKI